MEKTKYIIDIEYVSMEDKRAFEVIFDKNLSVYKESLAKWNPENNLTISKS